MTKLLVGILGLSLGFNVFCAEISQRVLKRASVIDCASEETVAPVIVTVVPAEVDGSIVSPEVLVEGNDPVRAEVSCTSFDSYTSSVVAGGTLLLWREGEQPITQMLYTATIRNANLTYSTSDMVWVEPLTANGALYSASSQMAFLESGAPVQYEVSFLRNGADVEWVDLPSEYELVAPESNDAYADGFVRDNPDPATIFTVQRKIDGAIVTFELDYRTE